jgi:hypothetical protein
MHDCNLRESIISIFKYRRTPDSIDVVKLELCHCRLKNNETPFLFSNHAMMEAAKDRLLVVHNWDGGTYIPSTIVDIFKKSSSTAKHVFGVIPSLSPRSPFTQTRLSPAPFSPPFLHFPASAHLVL